MSLASMVFMGGMYFGKVQSISEDIGKINKQLQDDGNAAQVQYNSLQIGINANSITIAQLQSDFKNFIQLRQQAIEQRTRIDDTINKRIERLEILVDSLRDVSSRLSNIEDAVGAGQQQKMERR